MWAGCPCFEEESKRTTNRLKKLHLLLQQSNAFCVLLLSFQQPFDVRFVGMQSIGRHCHSQVIIVTCCVVDVTCRGDVEKQEQKESSNRYDRQQKTIQTNQEKTEDKEEDTKHRAADRQQTGS